MSGELRDRGSAATRRASLAALVAAAGCRAGGLFVEFHLLLVIPHDARRQRAAAATLGTGQVKAALILPVSAPGNAGIAGQAMRNAADMALAEFNAPNVQLLVKDDAGSAEGARQAAQQALNEGAEIILGPLFAQSVTMVGQVAAPATFQSSPFRPTPTWPLRAFIAELPSGNRRCTHRAIFLLGRKTLLCGAHPRQPLRDGGRGGVSPGHRASGWPNCSAGTLSA